MRTLILRRGTGIHADPPAEVDLRTRFALRRDCSLTSTDTDERVLEPGAPGEEGVATWMRSAMHESS